MTDQTLTRSWSSSALTPGAAHAARSASIRSAHDRTVPRKVTRPSRASTVMFETIRHLCDSIGVQSGDLLQCERRTPQVMVLRRPNGHYVEVDRVYAAFIEIHARESLMS